jgi:hypothetical protein
LDAAVQLVRIHGRTLLPVAAVLAIVEQAVLWPLREAMGVPLIGGSAGIADLGPYWLVLGIGAGLEALIIIGLGPIAGQAAAADLTHTPTRTRDLLAAGARRFGALAVIGPVVLILVTVSALLGPLWLVGYALFGLAGVALTIERRGPFSALGRAAALSVRGGMRATRVRILGYISWLLLRFGFFLGLGAAADFLLLGRQAAGWLLVVGLVLANTTAYATLAALDAAALLEVRIRSEALDLWLSRAAEHGALTTEALVTRK